MSFMTEKGRCGPNTCPNHVMDNRAVLKGAKSCGSKAISLQSLATFKVEMHKERAESLGTRSLRGTCARRFQHPQ